MASLRAANFLGPGEKLAGPLCAETRAWQTDSFGLPTSRLWPLRSPRQQLWDAKLGLRGARKRHGERSKTTAAQYHWLNIRVVVMVALLNKRMDIESDPPRPQATCSLFHFNHGQPYDIPTAMESDQAGGFHALGSLPYRALVLFAAPMNQRLPNKAEPTKHNTQAQAMPCHMQTHSHTANNTQPGASHIEHHFKTK